ncbi:MAG: hypothetical protein WC548_04385 [Candidatus Pacearchaeota archaeon]
MGEIDSWFLNLDKAVINALEFFMEKGLPKLDLGNFKRPLVIGSGNAIETGKILFSDVDAVFANESNYEHALKVYKNIDGAILISASGKKDAPQIGERLKKFKLKKRFLTCNPDAPAARYFDKKDIYVFPSLPEFYTYNTSTYMGMIIAKTKEDPKKILEFIKTKVDKAMPKYIGKKKAYTFLVDKDHALIIPMLQTKFIELFGRKFGRDVFTRQYAEVHAIDVVPTTDELFVSFGYKNEKLGEERLTIPLPQNANYGTIMAIGYYVIGKIQAGKKSYFKDNLENWAKKKGREVVVRY